MATMGEAASAKTCGICGEDCSGKPRIKDKAGKYFCKTCHDSALAQRAAKPASAAAPHATRPAPSPKVRSAAPPDNRLGMLESLIAEQNAAPAIETPGARLCPGCRTPLRGDTVVCTNCGFNTASGYQFTVQMAPPVIKGGGGGDAVWPKVFGIISMVLGGGLVVLHLIGLVSQISEMSQSGAQGAGRLGGGLIPLLMAGWLARSGHQILQRDASGISGLRRWAGWQLVLCALGIGCGAFLFANAEKIMSSSRNSDTSGIDFEVLAGAVLFVSIGMTIWPIISLIWTSRDAVKREVASWR